MVGGADRFRGYACDVHVGHARGIPTRGAHPEELLAHRLFRSREGPLRHPTQRHSIDAILPAAHFRGHRLVRFCGRVCDQLGQAPGSGELRLHIGRPPGPDLLPEAQQGLHPLRAPVHAAEQHPRSGSDTRTGLCQRGDAPVGGRGGPSKLRHLAVGGLVQRLWCMPRVRRAEDTAARVGDDGARPAEFQQGAPPGREHSRPGR
mmetsp:Transcript_78575/g.212695  ORF Transcript_78575/g.212695 Transcript_78575/m.212695 type:complete len:204 (-) Transcript_78575:293-904(-)